MVSSRPSPLADVLARNEKAIYDEWIAVQVRSAGSRSDLITEKELREQSREFLQRVREAAGTAPDGEGSAWTGVRELLQSISRARARQGFSPSETATFVFSLKEPIFTRLRQELGERGAIGLGAHGDAIAEPVGRHLQEHAQVQGSPQSDDGSGLASFSGSGVPASESVPLPALVQSSSMPTSASA